MAVRFVVPEHGIREIKDAISRDVLEVLEKEGIGLASTTIELTAFPTLRVRHAPESTTT